MAGGGTGGHVIPSLAVAAELRKLGHEALFIGTRQGMEATLVPRAGFALEWISIGGLQRVGLAKTLRSLGQLPLSVLKSLSILRRRRASAVFSMGGYVAAPVMLAAILNRTPVIVMEPNALPGLVSRKLGRFVRRALVNFEETGRYFPAGRTEVTGLPVRQEFFDIPERAPGTVFHVLITGGSRGSRALNQAVRESWPMFRDSPLNVRMVLQCGAAEHHELARQFNDSGLDGEVVPFIHDMPAAYAQADLVVGRAGAGAISELAAAGKPSLLIPFPFAADDHQRFNAQALQQAGAARMILERDWNGESLFSQVKELQQSPETLMKMARAARAHAKQGAARRACSLLIELGKGATPAHP